MGISGFLNQLKKNFEPSTNWFKNNKQKKYDYLFLDYHSMFYSTYELFYSEINYFLKLIFFIKYNATYNRRNILNTKEKSISYEEILNFIYDKYIDYFSEFNKEAKNVFLPNSQDTYQQVIDKINKIFQINFNDKIIILKTLASYVIRQTDNLSTDIIKDQYSNKRERTYIFFDGIPSLSKIKEQISRRANGIVNQNVINSIYENDVFGEFSLGFLNSKLLSSTVPSVGLDSEIVVEVKKLLHKDYIVNSTVGINKYGEAEHQMMKYIDDNRDKFLQSDLLISSPDADLILLIFIKRINNFRIDLLKLSPITELKINQENVKLPFEYVKSERGIISPYSIENEYIIIDNLLSAMGLIVSGVINNQSIMDISFILLLLGDDFIPIISTMDIYKLGDIIKVYVELSKHENYKIINFDHTYKINFENLKIYIHELSKKEPMWKSYPKGEYKVINDTNANIQKLEKIYFYDRIRNREFNIQTFKTSYYFEKSGLIYYPPDNFDFSLLKKRKAHSGINDEQIQNYLEGYSFILDIYFNNSLKNYRWIYNYKKAPSLAQLNTFLSTKNDECVLRELFDYTKSYKDTYLDLETYLKFKSNNTTEILRILLEKIILDQRNFADLGTLHNASSNKQIMDELCKKYFIFDMATLNILFNCDGERYINKCVDIDNFLPILMTSEYERPINTALLGGYYQKYLKYKNKYISLKNNIKII